MRTFYKYKNILINITLIITIGILVILSQNAEAVVIEKEVECDDEVIIKEVLITNDEKYVLADVKGMVVNEGVYKLESGSRVIDFINEAGGFKKGADTININLSRVVKDSDVIYVFDEYFFENDVIFEEIIIYEECICPDVTYEKCIDDETKEEENENGLININEASIDLLITLPGIGEARAKDIIEYREKTPFEEIKDIQNVSGIGEASYNNIKEFITV